MSNLTIAIIFGIGFSGWVYSKIYRSTGGNNKSAITAAAGSGFVVGFILFILLSMFMK
jgi:hypothetical protein